MFDSNTGSRQYNKSIVCVAVWTKQKQALIHLVTILKQENLKIVLDLIQKNYFMTSADLTDAYFSIEIYPEYRNFSVVHGENSIMFLKCFLLDLLLLLEFLPSVLKPVFAWFRQQRIRCSYYIDDSLCFSDL
jgi:hypothetical protein